MAVFSQILRIFFYKGDTHTVQYTIIDTDGVTPLNITGGSGTLTVTNSSNVTVATVSGTIPVGVDGVINYRFQPSDTSSLTGGGTEYNYKAKITLVDGSVYTIAVDKLVLQG